MTKPDPISRLQAWRDRAGTLPPALAAALEACLAKPVDQTECADVLDLLAMLGCDAPTQAAALWFALSRVDPALWQAEAPQLSVDVRRLVEGQQAAEQVWALHAQHARDGGSEGLRRLLLAIIPPSTRSTCSTWRWCRRNAMTCRWPSTFDGRKALAETGGTAPRIATRLVRAAVQVHVSRQRPRGLPVGNSLRKHPCLPAPPARPCPATFQRRAIPPPAH